MLSGDGGHGGEGGVSELGEKLAFGAVDIQLVCEWGYMRKTHRRADGQFMVGSIEVGAEAAYGACFQS